MSLDNISLKDIAESLQYLKIKQMKIGIIGTGAIGGTIAKKMIKAGHQVKVSNRDIFEELEKKANEIGALPASLMDVVKDVDVVILSIPTIAIPDLPKNLFEESPQDLIVVDTSNYYPFRDGEIEELKAGKVESVWVSEQIGRPVIKAFNNLFISHSAVLYRYYIFLPGILPYNIL